MKKVLLCDDNYEMLVLLKTLLDLEGYQTYKFEGKTQNDLVYTINSEIPDVLLMDVHLHQSNGLDFLKAIRSNGKFQKLQIIMTSGMDLRDICINSGANAFLLKPFMPDELVSTLRSICGEKT